MVVIRLARAGSKKNPFYHLVVADHRFARDGRFVENVGYFNPMARGKATRLSIEKDRIDYWVSQGAQPSERVNHLVKEFIKHQGTEPAMQKTRLELRQEQADASAHAAKKAAQAKAKEEAAAAANAAEEPQADATTQQ